MVILMNLLLFASLIYDVGFDSIKLLILVNLLLSASVMYDVSFDQLNAHFDELTLDCSKIGSSTSSRFFYNIKTN
jgi:hypothetical protein